MCASACVRGPGAAMRGNESVAKECVLAPCTCLLPASRKVEEQLRQSLFQLQRAPCRQSVPRPRSAALGAAAARARSEQLAALKKGSGLHTCSGCISLKPSWCASCAARVRASSTNRRSNSPLARLAPGLNWTWRKRSPLAHSNRACTVASRKAAPTACDRCICPRPRCSPAPPPLSLLVLSHGLFFFRGCIMFVGPVRCHGTNPRRLEEWCLSADRRHKGARGGCMIARRPSRGRGMPGTP